MLPRTDFAEVLDTPVWLMKTALQKKIRVNADSQICNVGAVSPSRAVTSGWGL